MTTSSGSVRVGIIGHASEKFHHLTEHMAKSVIANILDEYGPNTTVVSGRSPMGGIDVWAEEEADRRGLNKIIFPAKRNTWEGGFKERNIQIAATCDVVHIAVVRELPPDFRGMRFSYCYHCTRRAPMLRLRLGNAETHIKSGACWTGWYAWEHFNIKPVWTFI